MGRLPLLERGPGGAAAAFERASAGDLMELASDVGPMRMQIGALLRLAPNDTDPASVMRLLAARAEQVPRLRQVLRRVPPGCGRPVWVDAAGFSASDQVRRITVPDGGDDALLRAAAGVLAEPMSYAGPLWRAAVLEDGRALAVVFAVHHVLADGIGGLAVLSRLVDGVGQEGRTPAPRPLPSRRQLAADAMRNRWEGVGRAPAAIAQLPAAIAGIRDGRIGAGPDTSLRRPVSGRLGVAAAQVRLSQVRCAAGGEGATVNDALLAAVAGMLGRVLAERGEHLERVQLSVPVSLRPAARGRAPGADAALGNRVGTMLLAVPTGGQAQARIRAVAALTVRRKAGARAGSGSVVVSVFRALGAVRLLRPLIEHQRMVDAFVSNVPGPREPVSVHGAQVVGIVPVTTLAGNVTISILALSYAGGLTVSISADPAVLPDVAGAARLLQQELQAVAGSP